MGRTKGSSRLARLTEIRTGFKENLNAVLVRLEEELNKDSPSEVKLSVESEALTDKEARLRTMNEEIQSLLAEGDLAEEMIQEEQFLDRIVNLRLTALKTVERRFDSHSNRSSIGSLSANSFQINEQEGGRAGSTASSEFHLQNFDAESIPRKAGSRSRPNSDKQNRSFHTESHREVRSPFPMVHEVSSTSRQSLSANKEPRFHMKNHIKKPAIELKKFDGKDWAEWPEFWDGFCSGIHEDFSLSNSEKLNYLKSLLESDALNTIKGIRLTDSNYLIVVDLLKKKYGREDMMINQHVSQLLNMKKVEKDDIKKLRKFVEKVEFHIRALENLGKSADSYVTVLVPFLSTRLPQDIHLLWSRRNSKTDVLSLFELLDFLRSETEARERTFMDTFSAREETTNKTKDVGFKFLPSAAALISTTKDSTKKQETLVKSCGFCRKPECSPSNCKDGEKLSVNGRLDKLKENGGCFCCLFRGHMSPDCKERDTLSCKVCSKKHHTLLHQNNGVIKKAITAASCQNNTQRNKTMFRTARALLVLGDETKEIRVLFDGASDRTWIRRELTKSLIPKGQDCVNLQGVGANYKRGNPKYFEVEIRSIFDPETTGTIIQVSTLDKIVHGLTKYEIPEELLRASFTQFGKKNSSSCLLSELNMAVVTDSYEEVDIDILIGIDHEWDFYLDGVLKPLGKQSPVVLETKLGWVLTGPLTNLEEKINNVVSMVTVTNLELDESIKKTWELEAIGIQSSDQKSDDEEDALATAIFQKTLKYSNGRYEVGLPIPTGKEELENNRFSAVKRLEQQERRMEKDPYLKINYEATMEEYLREGWAEESPKIRPAGRIRYLPHRMVIKPLKETTQYRLCFDGSSKGVNDLSLNDVVLPGPNPVPNLFRILIRLRLHQIVICADVRKMFLMVEIRKSDRDYLSFVYRHKGIIKDFRMAVAGFGVNAFPFICTSIVKEHAKKYLEVYPMAAKKLIEDMFIDDLVSGADTEEEAISLYYNTREIMSTASFDLRKWRSNSPKLRQVFVSPLPEKSEIKIQEKATSYVLGVIFNSDDDTFNFSILDLDKELAIKEGNKRMIASIGFRIYDPLGFISPYTLKVKLMIQSLWSSGAGWDDHLPLDIATSWKNWLDDMASLNTLKITRKIIPRLGWSSIQLHVFGDACEVAYGAVAYLRVSYQDEHNCSQVASKARTAPIKIVKLPRLELMAALIAVRLAKTLVDYLCLGPEVRIYLWSDSEIALHWIKGAPRRWKQFVANRVSEIQTLSAPSDWRHCPGKENPADICSRSASVKDLLNNSLWWEGPSWLKKGEQHWPAKILAGDKLIEPEDELKKVSFVLALTSSRTSVNLEKFSRLERLLRFTSKFLFFVRFWKAKAKKEDILPTFNPGDFDRATQFWIKLVQEEHFKDEITKLQAGETIDKKSGVRNLLPYLDKDGLMRMAGRLSFSNLPPSTVNPIILPGKSYFSELVIKYYHLSSLHGGVNHTLNAVREEYWITQSRQKVRKVVKSCVPCRKILSKATQQKMAPLPRDRVQEAFPFEIVGLDFAGPIYLKTAGSQEITKGYFCIFTCAVTRAVHLELCSSMSINSFWMAFQRFVSTRGRCAVIYSDNAKTFVSVGKDISKLWQEFEKFVTGDEAGVYLAIKKIKWKLIAERAPWWGGMYERLVRSVKEPLKKVLGKSSLNAEEMGTLLKEIECMMNSRPITYLSDDPFEPKPLTPFHFLLGRSTLGIPETNDLPGVPTLGQANLTKILKNREKLLNKFWESWRKDYLRELNSTVKWATENPPIKLGEVVLISEDNKPRLYWLMGVITEIIPGKDGLIRSVLVRVGKNTLRRPVQRLHRLEIQGPDENYQTVPGQDNREMETTDIISVGHAGDNVVDSRPILTKTRCGRAVNTPARFNS